MGSSAGRPKPAAEAAPGEADPGPGNQADSNLRNETDWVPDFEAEPAAGQEVMTESVADSKSRSESGLGAGQRAQRDEVDPRAVRLGPDPDEDPIARLLERYPPPPPDPRPLWRFEDTPEAAEALDAPWRPEPLLGPRRAIPLASTASCHVASRWVAADESPA